MRCEKITGSRRKDYLDIVWSLYKKTYGKIGTHLSSPSDLLKYDLWELCGNPVKAFSLSKLTKYGIKAGLSGTDGSGEGKSQLKNLIKKRNKTRGRYGEVSHKIEDLARRSNAPVVCATQAAQILGKPIKPLKDGIHYKRSLGGLGTVKKVLVGRPLGVPTTSFDNPVCPINKLSYQIEDPLENEELSHEILAHLSCLLD